MSQVFGQINQIGYVVRDARAAMNNWLSFGVGPFYYFESYTLPYMKYRGVESSVDFRVAKANSGHVQIEIIEPLDETPSPWRDYLDAGREGAQHVAYWTQDFAGLLERARALGYEICMQGTVEPDGGTRGGMAYLDRGPVPGTMIEISDRSGSKAIIDEKIRQASIGWDGTNPVRGLAEIWNVGVHQQPQ